jgi:hypothetical protein
MKCSKIRRLIDHAERPDILPAGVVSHTELCGGCRGFADERARLREVLLAAGRVNAPPDFDAMLRMRLAERRERKAFSWLSPAGYLRAAGAVTAMALVAFGAIYVTRNTDPNGESQLVTSNANTAVQMTATATADSGVGIQPNPVPAGDHAAVVPPPVTPSPLSDGRRQVARQRQPVARTEPAPVIWLRSDEMEVGVPMVSVGAQSLYYASGHGAAKTVRTSF